MAGLRRLLLSRAEPGFTLPAFDRIAPPPPPELVRARLESGSAPGDIVADLFGRGGWIARAAIDRQRRAFSLESSPLTRLLAEVVLRPPDLRHLDAAFSSLAASPLGESSLRLSINDLFTTKCATCGRNVTVDRSNGPTARRRRSTTDASCAVTSRVERSTRRSSRPMRIATARTGLSGPPPSASAFGIDFPCRTAGEGLIDDLLGLHSERQLVGLAAILARVEGDLRAAPVESALRLAFLHAVLPASRLGLGSAKIPTLRIASGRVKTALPERWHERNPWLAFEDGFRLVRGLRPAPRGRRAGSAGGAARIGPAEPVEGAPNAVVRVLTPGALEALAREARDHGPRIRLVLGQPPARFNQERLGATYHATAWTLGREAAALLPLEPLLGPAVRAPWSWQATALRRSLEAAAPHLARDARAVLLLDHGGPEALVAAVLGGVGAGYRLVEARLTDPDDEVGGIVELVPPGGILPPGPLSRSNTRLEPGPGRPRRPGPGAGARAVRAAGADRGSPVLAARGRRDGARDDGRGAPRPWRAGELRAAARRDPRRPRSIRVVAPPACHGTAARPGPMGTCRRRRRPPCGRDGRRRRAPRPGPRRRSGRGIARGAAGAPPETRQRTFAQPQPPSDPVDRVLALIHDELARPTQHRLAEVEPGRWWLGDRHDRETAAIPLADRVEWAVYSLLSTAGPIAETAFFERVAALFSGHDLPDEALVRAALASYRSPASTAARLVTHEDLRRRTGEHAELLAHLANGGHRLGMRIWIGRRDQARQVGDRTLGDYLDPHREREPWFPTISIVPKEDGEAVDCIWYQRGGTALLWEVEWTAMLGDVLLRRHARIPPDDRIIRFLAIPAERRELARHKLEASSILRDAMEAANWHFILWPHLRAWLERDPLDLADLEPYLGLEPPIERRAEQLPLF